MKTLLIITLAAALTGCATGSRELSPAAKAAGERLAMMAIDVATNSLALRLNDALGGRSGKETVTAFR